VSGRGDVAVRSRNSAFRLAALLRGSYVAYRAISARTVGAAMLGAARSGRRGVQRYTHEGIGALARLGASHAQAAAQSRPAARAR